MIKYTNTRNNGGDDDVSTMEKSVARAMWGLVYFELGYGGRVTDVQPCKVSVTTHCLSAVDKVDFEGTEEEIEPLVKAILLHEETRIKDINKIADTVMSISKGNALRVSCSTPLVMGGVFGNSNKLKIIAAVSLGIEDSESLNFLLNVDKDEFGVVLELMHEGASIDELKEALQHFNAEFKP